MSEWPSTTSYKGVAIHAGRPAKRIALVKREIDRVNRISDPVRLYEIAGDPAWAPEARILAGARCSAALQLATERRQPRPDIWPEDIAARVAGLSSRTWADGSRYCCLLDTHSELAVPRERPLPDDE